MSSDGPATLGLAAHTPKHEAHMEQRLVEHRHAFSSWLTVHVTRDTMKTVLVVETDLVLNVQVERYRDPRPEAHQLTDPQNDNGWGLK